ncbi:hypothetical protein GIB67_039823 [Kingdonia uniflora]|uniref:Uncharacterized protein n=1 Tax=Kingdonia uniflora TaxID=39325 RepID=A0A7J7P3N9_9MAGN|nr:hypothetical protein GIB67_039823 [Kingdonia uniflora]
MNEGNIEAPPMANPPLADVSQNLCPNPAPIDDTYPLDRSFLLSFKFHLPRSIYLWEEPGCLRVHHPTPSWHLDKEPRILVENFKKNLYIDEDFFDSMKTGGQGNSLSLIKLVNFYVGKLDKYNDSLQNASASGKKKKAMSALSVAHTYMLIDACDLLKFREAFDNYKVEDVVWDPYRTERRSDHDFNENTFFNGLTSSPNHVEPIYPDRVVRQFARIQPIPNKPKCVEVSGLRTWDGEESKLYKSKLPTYHPRGQVPYNVVVGGKCDLPDNKMEDLVEPDWSKLIRDKSPPRDANEHTLGVCYGKPYFTIDSLLAEMPYKGQTFDIVDDASSFYEQYGRK